MDDQARYQERLASLLGEIAVEEGLQPTLIQGVHVFKGSQSVPRAPMVYRPHIIIVGQGQKRAYLGGETYRYDPANYLVLAVPLPAECDAETEDGKPILMVNIDVDATMVGEMLLEIDGTSPLSGETPRGISSTPMSPGLGGAVIRLGIPQVPGRQPPPRPPDGARGRLPRAQGRARRGPLCVGEPGRPLHADRPCPEAYPFGLREAARHRGDG